MTTIEPGVRVRLRGSKLNWVGKVTSVNRGMEAYPICVDWGDDCTGVYLDRELIELP
jgi:hypothetical protein